MSRNCVYIRAALEEMMTQACDARLPVRLPAALKAAVSAHAAARGEDVSAFIRRAIVTTIVGDQVQADNRRRRRAAADLSFDADGE